jgi:hypothetical protein
VDRRASLLSTILALVGMLAAASLAFGQPSAGDTVIDPRPFGFDAAPGVLRRGDGRRVVVDHSYDEEKREPVVAEVYATIGDAFVLLAPDGRLICRKERETTPTEKPFAPLSSKELASVLKRGALADFKVQQTKRYVFLYNTSEEFATATSRILGSMLPGIAKHAAAMKIETHEPRTPLVAVMFRTQEEFQRYRRMPPGVLAYYDVISNQIVMHEEPPSPGMKRELAIAQAFSTIAHEGAHQILHNIGVQQRLSFWPMWLAEGMAEFFAPTSTDRKLTWKGAGHVNNLRMFELEQYFTGHALSDDAGRLIEQTVGSPRLSSTGYAAAWGLCHYLDKREREAFHTLVRDVSRLGPFEGAFPREGSPLVEENIADFRRRFGNDLAAVESKFTAHLNRQPYVAPFADAVHYVAAVAFASNKRITRRTATFIIPSMAESWRQELLASLTAEQRASSESGIHPFANRALAETFAAAWRSER